MPAGVFVNTSAKTLAKFGSERSGTAQATPKTKWPSLVEIRDYREAARDLVLKTIREHPALDAPLANDAPTDSADVVWALGMIPEHERIHLETSTTLIRELPLSDVRRRGARARTSFAGRRGPAPVVRRGAHPSARTAARRETAVASQARLLAAGPPVGKRRVRRRALAPTTRGRRGRLVDARQAADARDLLVGQRVTRGRAENLLSRENYARRRRRGNIRASSPRAVAATPPPSHEITASTSQVRLEDRRRAGV